MCRTDPQRREPWPRDTGAKAWCTRAAGEAAGAGARTRAATASPAAAPDYHGHRLINPSQPYFQSSHFIMAAKFVVILAACVALSHSAMVRRDAPAGGNAFEEIEKHAKEFQKTFSEQFNSLVNSKNTQDFNKALKDGSDSVLQQLSAFSSSLQGAISDANGKAKEALEQARQNVEKTAEELRKAHPDVEKEANAFKDKLQAAVQTTVQESQKLAKEVASNMEETNKKLAPKIKQAYDDFVKHAEEVQKKLHEAASKQ
ncbi:hypothetical protein O3G_MSEX010941 [Manduca sexta]|uniref:Apolipophorin-III n=2 Tax=Manduca sexta TaxID=7130 RepID=A0A922CT74_MANSE|nr:hypothetical protein O3G_MSEX010941 [Manduca sexta]KAG6458600.1 hypothetical protein O3G_MSEX010941 [Manduca sexta]